MELSTQRLFWFLTAAVVAISACLYWPSPKMGFVLDDHYVVDRNPVVKNPALVSQVWTKGLFDAAHRAPESRLNYYRPVLTASLAADYRLWGSGPFGFRLVNIALHAINSVLVFVLLSVLFGHPRRAMLAALVFCILPSHEWVVRYIVGRGDLLQMLFSCLCLIAVVRQLRAGARMWWYVSLICFILALLSREAAVLNVLYIFVVAYVVTRDFKKTFWTLTPFFVIAAGYHTLRLATVPVVEGNPWSGLRTGIEMSSVLLTHWILPGVFASVIPHAGALVSALALCIFVVYAQSYKRHQLVQEAPVLWSAVAWMAIGILPLFVTHRMIERLGPVLSDHFLYMSSVGFALIVALLIDQISNPSRARIVFTAVLIYCLTAGFINGFFWQSEKALLTHVQHMEQREGTVAFEQLAMRFNDDETVVRRLLARASNDSARSLWLKRLGNIYHRRGETAAAQAALKEALRFNPSNIEALNELGALYLEDKDVAKGTACLAQSLRVDPEGFEAWRLLGLARYTYGDVPGSIPLLNRSLVLNPDQQEAALYLMMAQFFTGDQAGYLRTMERVSARFSDDRAVVKFAARELFARGRFAETVKVLAPTQSLFAQDPATLALLAEARRRSGRLPAGE